MTVLERWAHEAVHEARILDSCVMGLRQHAERLVRVKLMKNEQPVYEGEIAYYVDLAMKANNMEG
jgi:hypothetical protein